MPRKKKITTQTCFSAEEIENFREMLHQEQLSLSHRIRRTHVNLQANRSAGEESADIGSDDFIRETGFSMLGNEADTLRMINTALENIEKGTYGICQDCGQPIAVGRLIAKPHAKYCVDCKERREQNGDLGPNDLNY